MRNRWAKRSPIAFFMVLPFILAAPTAVSAEDITAPRLIATEHCVRNDRDYWMEGFIERVKKDFVCSQDMPVGPEFSGGFDHDGHLYNVRITKSSNNVQTDVECLLALLEASQYKPDANLSYATLHNFVYQFEPAKKSADFSKAVSEYQKRSGVHYDKNIDIILFKIPMDVLETKPGMFAQKELLSPDNFFTIRNNAGDVQLALSKTLKEGTINNIAEWMVSWRQCVEGGHVQTKADTEQFASNWYKHLR